jgi:hypothetical protein
MVWSKSKDYWQKVLAKKEKQEAHLKIKKAKVTEIEDALARPGEPPFCNRAYVEFICRPLADYDPTPDERVWRSYDDPYRSKHEFARGIRKLEMAEGKQKAFTRSSSSVAVAPVPRRYEQIPKDSGEDDGAARATGPWRQGALPISRDEWKARGYSVQQFPERLYFPPEDRQLAAKALAKSPGKPVGRPPRGERAKTKRSRKSRNKEQV